MRNFKLSISGDTLHSLGISQRDLVDRMVGAADELGVEIKSDKKGFNIQDWCRVENISFNSLCRLIFPLGIITPEVAVDFAQSCIMGFGDCIICGGHMEPKTGHYECDHCGTKLHKQ